MGKTLTNRERLSMAKWKVLISAPYLQPVLARFRPIFDAQDIELVVPTVHERLEEDDLLPIIGDIDGVIAGDDRFTARVIAAAPKLKVLSKWGTGIDSFDKAACEAHGVAIKNTPNAFSDPVADSVLGYILAFARNISFMDRQMKAQHWEKIPGRALRECTLGIVGVGNVGRAVTKRAHAFGMTILGNDPLQPPTDFIEQYGVQMVTLDNLLQQSDFVSLNCDLNPTSYHIINQASLKMMPPHAVLINTARGPLIHEAALVQALQSGQIAGAGLDVFEEEPLPHDSPLLQLDRVLLAPHNSNSSPEAWEHVHHNTINNLLEVLKEHDNG